jgi:hypothetical protein
MTASQIISRSEENLGNAATFYLPVVTPFTPPRPFKGLHVGVAGSVTLTGVDGVPVTLQLAAGCWPYGGLTITAATATGVVALF